MRKSAVNQVVYDVIFNLCTVVDGRVEHGAAPRALRCFEITGSYEPFAHDDAGQKNILVSICVWRAVLRIRRIRRVPGKVDALSIYHPVPAAVRTIEIALLDIVDDVVFAPVKQPIPHVVSPFRRGDIR